MNLNNFETNLNKDQFTKYNVRKLLNYAFKLQEENLNLEENNRLLKNGSSQLLEEIKRLINDREVLVEILKELEFVEDTGRIGGAIFKFCPICKSARGVQPHSEDCKFNKVLELYR